MRRFEKPMTRNTPSDLRNSCTCKSTMAARNAEPARMERNEIALWKFEMTTKVRDERCARSVERYAVKPSCAVLRAATIESTSTPGATSNTNRLTRSLRPASFSKSVIPIHTDLLVRLMPAGAGGGGKLTTATQKRH